MPNLLITTSRRTSNRVRSFARDLWSVLPGSERFNRGGMGIQELVSRIRQSGARTALIISIWKGNPGEMILLSPEGTESLKLRLDSALLRREMNPEFKGRVGGIEGVCIKSGSSPDTIALANEIATIFDLHIHEVQNPIDVSTESSRTILWFEDISSGKILWTHYNTRDLIEMGPRIKIGMVWRGGESELE